MFPAGTHQKLILKKELAAVVDTRGAAQVLTKLELKGVARSYNRGLRLETRSLLRQKFFD